MEMLMLRPAQVSSHKRPRIKKHRSKIHDYMQLCNMIKKSDLEKKDILNFWCAKRGQFYSIDSFNPQEDTVESYVKFIFNKNHANAFLTFLNNEYGQSYTA